MTTEAHLAQLTHFVLSFILSIRINKIIRGIHIQEIAIRIKCWWQTFARMHLSNQTKIAINRNGDCSIFLYNEIKHNAYALIFSTKIHPNVVSRKTFLKPHCSPSPAIIAHSWYFRYTFWLILFERQRTYIYKKIFRDFS